MKPNKGSTGNIIRLIFAVILLTVASFAGRSAKALDTPAEQPVTPDGTISDGEYPSSASFNGGNYILFWRIDGDTVCFGIEAKTGGWVALGLKPSSAMKDADLILGWVDSDGKAQISDEYCTVERGPHQSDVILGGTQDIESFGGSEKDGKTVFEFTRKLDTGDPWDKALSDDEEVLIIWAMGASDEVSERHASRGSGTITLGNESTASSDGQKHLLAGFATGNVPIWPFHAGLMVIGFILVIFGISFSRRRKSIKGWLKTHRAFGFAAMVFVILGAGTAIAMVSKMTGLHLHSPHAILGAVTALLSLATPIGGYYSTKSKTTGPRLKSIHGFSGYVTAVLVLLAIIAGLFKVGIL